LRRWYGTRAGQCLLHGLDETLEALVGSLFGYHALQMGVIDPSLDFSRHSRIPHWVRQDIVSPARVMADAHQLPWDAESLDLVTLLHVLEFSERPHEVLREVERTLIPEGHVVIVGFNPWSLMGLWQGAQFWREGVPWCGHFYSALRINDWLALLGFDTLRTLHYGFRAPINRLTRHCLESRWERWGRRWWPYFGSVHVILARKRVATLTPIRPRWSKRSALAPGRLTEPTTRNMNRERTG
jgi:SAM-dependent methyltransferase